MSRHYPSNTIGRTQTLTRKGFICFFLLIFSSINFAKPTSVTVKTLDEIAIYPLRDAPATAMSLNQSTLSAEIAGRIVQVLTQVGDHVSIGQAIARIDCTENDLTVKRAEADLKALESDLSLITWQSTQAKKLAKTNNASEELVKKYASQEKVLQAKVANQQAMLETAKTKQGYCVLRAPFAGVITHRYTNLGEYVIPGTKVIDMVDTEHLEVEAQLHEKELVQLQETNSIIFSASDQTFPVQVRAIVPSRNPQSRTQTVRLLFSKNVPLPGTPGRLVWSSERPAIPAEYVRQINQTLGVFLAEGDHAIFMPLPDAIEGQPAQLNNPIQLPLIINGRYAVQDGSSITVLNHE